METFEQMLTGGHPNSLGRTIEVVEIILKDQERFEELYQCYFSEDEVVRLRVSNAMKRICKEYKEWLVPYIDKFITEISKINQASTKWTLAQLFMMLEKELNDGQIKKATEILKKNLVEEKDWIALNFTMEALVGWAKNDEELKTWLKPRIEKLKNDPHKSVARRAEKYLQVLSI